MSGVTLATPSAAFEARVRRAFGMNGDLRRWYNQTALDDPAGAVRDIARNDPEVVGVGPGVPLETGLHLAWEFERAHPEVAVLIVTEPSPDVWEQALRAGARDVVDPEGPDDQVARSFALALETAGRRRSLLLADPGGPRPSGRVITVVSPKGGSGKTVMASNLGVGLARLHPGQVALVDLDLQFGDLANVLLLMPENTLADAAWGLGRLDGTTLKVFLTPHASELYVLCAPDDPAQGEAITAAQAAQAIELLSAEFPYVVVDTASGLTEHTLAALELSTDMVLVCDMDVSSVQALRKQIEALDRLSMSAARRHLVLNRADSKVGLDPNDISATLGMVVDVRVPSSRVVPLSCNRGSPVLESDPRASVSKALAELVQRFAVVPARSGGWLRWRGEG